MNLSTPSSLPLIDLILIVVAAVAGTVALITTGILVYTLKKRQKTAEKNTTLPTVSETVSQPEYLRASRLHEKYYPKSGTRKPTPHNPKYYMPSAYTPSPKIGSGSRKFDEMSMTTTNSMKKIQQQGPVTINSPIENYYSHALSKEKSAVTLACVSETSLEKMENHAFPSQPPESYQRGRRVSKGAPSIILSYIRQYSSSSTLSSIAGGSDFKSQSDDNAFNDAVKSDVDGYVKDNSFKHEAVLRTPLHLSPDESIPLVMTAQRVTMSGNNAAPVVLLPQQHLAANPEPSSIKYGIAYTTMETSPISNPPELTMDDDDDDPFKDLDSSNQSWSPVTERYYSEEATFGEVTASSTPKKSSLTRHPTPHIKKIKSFEPKRVRRRLSIYSNNTPPKPPPRRSRPLKSTSRTISVPASSVILAPTSKPFYNFKDISFPLPSDEFTN
jgi:hypothetical protein